MGKQVTGDLSTDHIDYLQLTRELPLREVVIAEKKWTYISTGHGDYSILFIRGVGASVDIWWQQIVAMDRSFRIIALDYPAEPSPEKIANAINTIIKRERVNKLIIVGNSYGGCIAQWYAARNSNQVTGLVLTNTYLPQASALKRYLHFFKIVKFIPEWLGLILFAKINDLELSRLTLEYPQLANYFKNATKKNINKKALQSIFHALNSTTIFDTSKLNHIPTLILDSKDDKILEIKLCEELKDKYKWASCRTFETGGHFPFLTQAGKFNVVLLEFIANVKLADEIRFKGIGMQTNSNVTANHKFRELE